MSQTEKTRVKVHIDINSGELDIDAPVEQYADIVSKISEIIPKLRDATQANVGETSSSGTAQSDKKGVSNSSETGETKKRKASSSGTKSKLGAAKYNDFRPFKLEGIDDHAEMELKEFYDEKKPKSQDEQVAVIVYKLAALLKREALNYDEIYQGFRLAQETHPPKSMAGVISNMSNKMLVERLGDGVRLKIQGTDLVEKMLPRPSK
ncbi:MAG: hypothetical protein ACR2O4_09660 [Hyphomicrobiaceae bacterium]